MYSQKVIEGVFSHAMRDKGLDALRRAAILDLSNAVLWLNRFPAW
eukprot:COSAG02_NODE_2322_length_9135_cov_14.916335_1_plen_45_part_00